MAATAAAASVAAILAASHLVTTGAQCKWAWNNHCKQSVCPGPSFKELDCACVRALVSRITFTTLSLSQAPGGYGSFQLSQSRARHFQRRELSRLDHANQWTCVLMTPAPSPKKLFSLASRTVSGSGRPANKVLAERVRSVATAPKKQNLLKNAMCIQ